MTSGAALLGLGLLGAAMAFVGTVVLKLELGFIDGRSMLVVSAIMATVGLLMVRHGRRELEQER